MTNAQIIELYRQYSELRWAAGFMHPGEEIVRSFREWLATAETGPILDYEKEMLEIFHRQEAEGKP